MFSGSRLTAGRGRQRVYALSMTVVDPPRLERLADLADAKVEVGGVVVSPEHVTFDVDWLL